MTCPDTTATAPPLKPRKNSAYVWRSERVLQSVKDVTLVPAPRETDEVDRLASKSTICSTCVRWIPPAQRQSAGRIRNTSSGQAIGFSSTTARHDVLLISTFHYSRDPWSLTGFQPLGLYSVMATAVSAVIGPKSFS